MKQKKLRILNLKTLIILISSNNRNDTEESLLG